MLQIAICDDRMDDLNRTVNGARKWLEQNVSLEGRIDTYHNAEELKKVVQDRKAEYDLYILDIVMHGTNGIEFGQWIQQKCQDSLMIYVTSSRDYALDAFDNHAVRYLMKPVEEKELCAAMDTAYSLYKVKPRHMLTINTRDQICSVAMEDIMYIENNLKNMRYTLKDGRELSSARRIGTFEDSVGSVAESGQFIQPHKSFFVNMKYISALKGDCILMDDGREVPVARRRVGDTQARYMSYISAK